MRNTAHLVPLLAVSLTAAALLPNVARSATPPTPDQARIEDLQQQVDALNQELIRLKATSDPEAQQQLMQHHWSMMQGYMRFVREMPGMHAHGCTDWMMMDPSMMGPGMMGPGMMGTGMCGGSMWGHDSQPGGMWGMPSHMAPGAYQSQMQGHMTRMRSQMAAIAAEKDPTKRETLLREHYETMYRGMQSMRGMGWMWAPNAAVSLPDRESQGAKLVATICSQCHSAPSPALHMMSDWAGVTARMRQHMQAQTGAAGGGVRIPSPAELDVLTQYLAGHAADALPPP